MFKVTKIRQSILTAMWGVTASVSTLALANEEIDTGITAEQQAQVVNAKDVKKLSDVIVTAQYRAQNIQKVPTAITAVSGKDLAAKGSTFIGDVLTYTPNAAAENPDGDSRPRWYIRGLGTGDVAASTVSCWNLCRWCVFECTRCRCRRLIRSGADRGFTWATGDALR
jgi:iron complex outermembrane receptor protein